LAVKRSRKTAGKTRKTKKAKKLATRSKRVVKSSNLKSGTNIGKLTLRQYVNAKRKAKQNEIREYEKQFLSRYKQPKSIPVKSKSYLHVPGEPKIDINKERKDYEREYVSKFKKLQKTKLKIAALEQKLRLSQIELEEPKRDINKERKDYEKEYLTRYKKQQKSKPKKSVSKHKKVIEIESDEKNQDVEIKILKKEPEPLSTKFESAKQEYNVTIKNLMDAKKVLNGIKEDIQKSNSEYADIISKIKSTRVELLNANSELRKKTEEIGKTTEEQRKKDSLIQEINNSKRELSEIKDEIKKYNGVLVSDRTKVDKFLVVKKMKEEKEQIENEIIQKRKELDSGFRELKFIKDEMAKSSKSEGTEKIVDAASAVVASMNQKLQTTLTELDAVKKALENERRLQKKSTQLDQDI